MARRHTKAHLHNHCSRPHPIVSIIQHVCWSCYIVVQLSRQYSGQSLYEGWEPDSGQSAGPSGDKRRTGRRGRRREVRRQKRIVDSMEKLGSMEQELHPLVLELTLHGAALCQQVDRAGDCIAVQVHGWSPVQCFCYCFLAIQPEQNY